jgi:hypothetical protein
MFVLRDQQCHQHIYIEKIRHGFALRFAVGQAIDLFDRQDGRATPRRKSWDTSLESDVGISDTLEECLHEIVDALPGLIG